MAGDTTRTQLMLARAIADLPAFFGAAGVGRVRRAGPVGGTTGH